MRAGILVMLLFWGMGLLRAQGLIPAISSGNVALAKKLIKQGEDVNQRDTNGATALMWAVLKTDLSFCKFLIKKGADSHRKGIIFTDSTRTQYYGNILGICALNRHYDWLEWFVKHEKIAVDDRELNLSDATETGWTALQYAVYTGDLNGVNTLLKLGADRHYVSPSDSVNMLQEAINYGHKALVKTILSYPDINIHHRDKVGYTALHYAVILDQYEIAAELIKAGLKVNAQSDSLITPLHACISSYRPNIAHLLLQHQADTALQNKWGETPGFIARYYGYKGLDQLIRGNTAMLQRPLYDSLFAAYSRHNAVNNTDSVTYYVLQLYAQAMQEYAENTGKYEQSLNLAGIGYFNSGRYMEAKQLFIRSLITLKTYRPRDTTDQCHYLKNIIATSKELNQPYDSIWPYMDILIPLTGAYYGQSSEQYLETRRMKIFYQSLAGETDMIAGEYRELLAYCEARQKNHSDVYYSILNSLLVLYANNHRQNEALTVFDTIYRHYRLNTLPASFDFKHTVKNICVFLSNESSLPKLKTYLGLYRALLLSEKPLNVKDLYTYCYLKGSYYYENQKGDSALVLYGNAVTLAKKYHTVAPHELAACYINMVNTCMLLEKVEWADRYLDTALGLYASLQQIVPGFYSELNTAQMNYYTLGEFAQCVQINEIMQAIALSEGDSLRYLQTKKNLFYASYRLGQLSVARENLNVVLAMQQRLYKARPEAQIPFFNDLGYFYTELKDSVNAIAYYRKINHYAKGLPQQDSLQLRANYKICQLSRADKAIVWLAKESARIRANKRYNQQEAQILEDYIYLLADQGQTDTALAMCDYWVRVFTGKDIIAQSEWLLNQGNLFNRNKNYLRAEPYYRAAEKLLLTRYEPGAKEMVLVHAKLGNNNYLAKKFDIAIPYMKKVIETEEKNAAALPDLIDYYNSLKIIYFGINDMPMAAYYSEKLVANNRMEETRDFAAWLKSRTDHITIMRMVGKYDEAEATCNALSEKMDKRKRFSPEDRLKVYGQMGYFYSEIGNRNKAILCVDSSTAILQRHFSDNLQLTYNATIQKALIYITNDRSEEGLYQLKRQNARLRTRLNDTSDILNETLSYLGLAYLYLKQFDSAKYVLQQVQHNYMRRNLYTTSLLSAIKYIAAIHSFNKQHDSALAKLQLARALVRKEKGMLDDYWSLNLSIANTFLELQQGDSAMAVLNYILSHQNDIGFSSKELLEETRLTKAYVLSFQGQYAAAYEHLSAYLSGRRAAVLDEILFLSASERETFLAKKGNTFRTVNLKLIPHLDKAPQFGNLILDNELFIKGLALETNTRLLQLAAGSGDAEAMQLMDLVKTGRKQLEALYKDAKEDRTETTALENKLSAWEKALNKKLGRNFKADYNRSYAPEIKNKLKPDELLVDFFSRDQLSASDKDTIVYFAIVLGRDYAYPKVVKISNNKALDRLFTQNTAMSSAEQLARIYESRGSVLVNNTSVDYGNCYDMIWRRIDSLAGSKKNIYITPSGYLNKIAFAAIKDPGQKYISDRYNIHILSSSRQMLKPAGKTAPAKRTGVVMGGIQYDMDSAGVQAVGSLATRSYTFDGDSANRIGFSYLPGTLSETNNIVSYLSGKKYDITYVTGKGASEGFFKQVGVGRPYFIHVATHGFYLPETRSRGEALPGTVGRASNPLLRSGLLLAGGNRAWLGEAIPQGQEDGILNAFEISNLDLSQTKFVVLSACETGLGDIRGSEGVFGLQRAFKLAGVEYIINSLWQVPDAQTSELMQAFYYNWVKGMPFEEAFFQAQKTLKAKYPPYYWAAFQLVR